MNEEPKVLSTTRYSQFKKIRGNRKINQKYLGRLKTGIEENNMLPYKPIVVNENMEVIDGQHRLEVAERLGFPIYYVVSPTGNIAEVQKLNLNARRWTLQDFQDSFVDRGREEYIFLKEFVENHGVSLSNAIYLLAGDLQLRKQALLDEFRNGDFKVRQKEWATEFLSKLKELDPYLLDGIANDREFLTAMVKTYKKVDHKDFLKHLSIAHIKIERQTHAKDYLRVFEDILSFKKKYITRLM